MGWKMGIVSFAGKKFFKFTIKIRRIMPTNIKDHPAVEKALVKSAKLLIDSTYQSGFEHPTLECTLDVEDGRRYKLTFERVDGEYEKG